MTEDLRIFVAAVKEMRDRQKEYFRTASVPSLQKAKAAEKHVDSLISSLTVQHDLFAALPEEKVIDTRIKGSGV